jgi:hypothetical protein
MRDNFKYDSNILEGFKQQIGEKYKKVIKEYGFPIDLIEDVCLGRIFH